MSHAKERQWLPELSASKLLWGAEVPVPPFSTDSLERVKTFPGDHCGAPHVGPTLLISTLAPKGNPHAKLQLRSQGCFVAKSFALVFLGAALFFLRIEPVKS